jgi:hypothetical protein
MGFATSKPLRVEGPHGRFIRDSGGALACSITNAPPASHADAPFLFIDLIEEADGSRPLERKPLGLARDGEDVATTVMFTGRGLASGKHYQFRLVCVKQRCCMKSEALLGASEAFQAVELASVIATGVGRGIAGSKLVSAGGGAGAGTESGEVDQLKRTVRRLSETNEALLAQIEQLRAGATPQARSQSGGSAGVSGSGARARASSKPRANSVKRW